MNSQCMKNKVLIRSAANNYEKLHQHLDFVNAKKKNCKCQGLPVH